ncbi:MAG: formimidoylglutamate deiminase [Alphaproteobacteria bacterium]|nr:formimidoylglutamate deiminase [Alphaproteobacteria bacterium]
MAEPISLWFEAALLPEGWSNHVRLSLADGLICAVKSSTPRAPGEPNHGIAIPGLCNLHSHAFQRGMAGLAETSGPGGDDFWSWREVMYRFLDRLQPEDVQAIAALAYVEMLESGFTRVGEFHYLHHGPDGIPYDGRAQMAEAIVEAAQESGIALTLLCCFYAHSDFGAQPPKPSQRRFINSLDGFAELFAQSSSALRGLADANIGIAPHSLRAVTPEELSQLLLLSSTAPLHIHAAEQIREVEASRAYLGASPVHWLIDHAGVDGRWCLVHATHMTPSEVIALARSKAVAGLCPQTEANLGDGIFPARDYLGAGGRFGLGTDSNILIDAATELRGIDYAQRLNLRRRNMLAQGASSGRTLFDAALTGGAQALGVPGSGLAVGASADIVALDAADVAITARRGDPVLDGWIYAGRSTPIRSVWRRGRRVVTKGRHVARTQIARRYRKILPRLMS